jgi:hypothetical protein
VALVGGAASLVGDLRLGPQRAEGSFLLLADGLRLALDQTELSGDLRAQVLVRDGSAADMRFDITGSALSLDRVRVHGRAGAAGAPDWHLRLQLEDTEVRWHKPMQLDMTAGIAIKDTRPFVALLDNVRGQHSWVDHLLTVEDLGGHLRLTIDGQDAVIQDAMVSSAEMAVHAKGRAAPAGREAMLLVRWHDLVGGLELQGAHKHFDLADARARFDAYRPGATPLPVGAAAGRQAPASGGENAGAPGRPVNVPPHQAHPDQGHPNQTDPHQAPQPHQNLFLDPDP